MFCDVLATQLKETLFVDICERGVAVNVVAVTEAPLIVTCVVDGEKLYPD
jgi:hypothetical protein